MGLLGLVSSLSFFAATTKETIYALSLVAICIGGLVSSQVYNVRLGRRARHAEIQGDIREAVRLIVEETAHGSRHGVEEKEAALVRAMDQLRTVFSILTRTPCRVCVKVVKYPVRNDADLEAITFCRDSSETDAGCAHPIKHNTDFNDLYQNPSKRWFFGNDLAALAHDGRYNNSHEGWRTKYRSTVVWPIRRLTNNPQAAPKVYGFLCVDSKRARVFSDEYDYPVGAMVADVLYPFLASLADSIEQPNRPVEATGRTAGVSAEGLQQPAEGEGSTDTHEH